VTTGQPVSLGIRPEHVLVSHPNEAGHFRGEVEVVEVLPSDRRQIVHILTAGVEVTATVPIEPAFQRGDTVSVTFPAARLHLFDGASERNVLASSPANNGRD
jgi:ABC-type sugar transport system ATPase subunit